MEAAALQMRVNPLRGGIPQFPLGLEQSRDFIPRELETLVTQGLQRLSGMLDEPKTQLFIGEQLADE
jgi:hypothetical protein